MNMHHIHGPLCLIISPAHTLMRMRVLVCIICSALSLKLTWTFFSVSVFLRSATGKAEGCFFSFLFLSFLIVMEHG